MEKRKREGRSKASLRRKAEQRMSQARPRPPTSQPRHDARRLVHELEVHQVELEIQNEELKSARADVEAALARYTEVFDFAPVGYATLTIGGRISSINHVGANLLGRPRKALLGHGFATYLAPRSRLVLAALIDAVQTSDRHEEVELELDPFLTVPRNLRLRATALAGADPCLLVTFEDITELKAKAERLARTEAALRESNERKDDFLAVLSHELRNPLAPIRSSLFLLKHVEPGDERASRAHTIIEQQVDHLTRLVDDLLDVTRITKGKLQLRREHVSLADLVGKTLEAQRGTFEAKGVMLRASFEPGEHWVFGDDARLVQALSNVLVNAQKFTPSGGTVTVGLRQQNDLVMLEVADTGVGIAPDVAGRLFEPFAQAPQSIERTTGGLGLGLATVKGLVELHGGSVVISSQGLGLGTTVTMTFRSAGPVRSDTSDTAAPEMPGASPQRVLVIEDNRDAAESLRDALALQGHEVAVAYNGPSGIATAQSFHPNVVICDIGLPGMDGYEVAAHFRAHEGLRDTYMVALTGYARPEDLDRAAQAGFHRHVAKPPTIEKLLELLQAVPPHGGPATDRPGQAM